MILTNAKNENLLAAFFRVLWRLIFPAENKGHLNGSGELCDFFKVRGKSRAGDQIRFWCNMSSQVTGSLRFPGFWDIVVSRKCGAGMCCSGL